MPCQKHLQLLTITFSIFFSYISLFAGHLGIGISLPERGGTMVDQVHEHYRWSKVGGMELTQNDVDERGWPTVDCRYIVDWRPVAEWLNEIDDPEGYRIDMSGLYKCSFNGQATLVNQGNDFSISNQVYNAGSNTTTFDITVEDPRSGHGLMVLEFIDTKRTSESTTGSGITNFKMIRPGYAHDSEQIFTDDFINTLTSADFTTIRFMDFRHTNNSEPIYPAVTEWVHRKLITDAGQGQIEPIAKLDGAAWEYVIELGNMVKVDIWINIQLSATTDYVTELANLIKDNLDPDLNVYVESSNEVWNNIFNQYNYNIAQANDLGIGEHENHARRTVELAQIFESVFGSATLNNKVRVVLCSHAPMLKWWVQPMLEYIDRNFGPPKDYIYAIARQTYFSTDDRGGTIEQLLDRCHNDIVNQISDASINESGRLQWIEKAAEWELEGGACSYEGGFHIPSGGSTDNLANQINMHRDARAGIELAYNYDDAFFAIGGNLAVQFTLTSGYNRYGCWGLTDDISNPDRNYKFQSIRDLINRISSNDASKRDLPIDYRLNQNYPNPFNPKTIINYELPITNEVKLSIFNLTGQKVATLVQETQRAGYHQVEWDASGFASGVYYYRIEAGEFVGVKKMVLIR
jgi:hypothetical protein